MLSYEPFYFYNIFIIRGIGVVIVIVAKHTAEATGNTGDQGRPPGDHGRPQNPVPAHRFWPRIRILVLYQRCQDP